MSHPRRKRIVVFGSSDPTPGEPAYEQARALGDALARAGYDLVNGGYGGTMAASARGARDAGGRTIGVTCNAFGPVPANPFIDQEIRTPNLPQRLATLIDLADGFVVLGGATGTLVELAMTWELTAKRQMPARPIVCLGEFWQPLIRLMADAGATRGDWLIVAPDVPAVVAALGRWSDR